MNNTRNSSCYKTFELQVPEVIVLYVAKTPVLRVETGKKAVLPDEFSGNRQLFLASSSPEKRKLRGYQE
jgi:hypothetical protein